MAHRGQEARLGEIGLLGAPPRLVGIGLGLFELGDQRVLLGLKGQRRQRLAVEPLGQNDEIDLRADRERGDRQGRGALEAAQGEDDRQGHGGQRAIGGAGNGGAHGGVYRGDEEEDDQDESPRVGVAVLQNEAGDEREGDALDRLRGRNRPRQATTLIWAFVAEKKRPASA